MSSPSALIKVNYLVMRYLHFESVRGDLQEGHFYDSRCQSPSFRAQNLVFCALLGSGTLVFCLFEHKIEVFVRFWGSEPSFSSISSTKSGFLCASYWGCWPGCGKIGLCERNTERWELKSRIGKGRVTLWVHRMCCGSRVLVRGGSMAGNREQNRRIWNEKSAQLWGLRAFTICFAARATLRKGTILPRAGMWPTARADCCGRLPGPTCRTRLRAGPDAGRGRLVELVLDEELDGLVFCHSEFVVEDCGVVVSLLCAEPEFSLV